MSTSSNMDERIERMKQAAQNGNIDAFYIIIEEDVQLLEYIDQLPFVDTPLHIAAYAGHIPFAMELMRLKPSFSRKLNPSGFSPIHLALQNGHSELVRRLLEVDGELFRVKGREGITPLHYVAATDDNLDHLEKFLEFCPHSIEDVTIRNENALHIALKYDKLDAFIRLVRWLRKNWSRHSILWESKVLNWKDEKGNTPLHIAVYKNQPKAVKKLLLYSGINIYAKNLEEKTAGDMILVQQNQIENREIKVMLRRVGAIRAPSLPRVTYYARYLWSMFSHVEQARMHCLGEWTEISDDRRNMLLVVATLLMTVTYQGVLSPPGGLWQDDYHPETNTTLPATRKFNSSAPIPNEAGTPVDLRYFPFWVFLSLNSLTFMLSYSTILLLIPTQRIYRIVRLSLISLSVCYIVSLTVIIPTRFWETFWYVSIALFLCIFLLNTSATCVAWSYKACL